MNNGKTKYLMLYTFWEEYAANNELSTAQVADTTFKL